MVRSGTSSCENRFVATGCSVTLTRYLRFMGYDTTSANGLLNGNADEDSLLLALAHDEHRIATATRDHELAPESTRSCCAGQGGDVLSRCSRLSIWGWSNDGSP